MKNNTKISIICPSYNHEKYIDSFLESVFKQSIQDFELIIVDDCSSDNTCAHIEKYTDSRLKLLKHGTNMGINATLTDGIKLANSDIVSIIASDDVLALNYIEETLNIFEKENNDVLYVSLNLIDENGLELNQQRIFDSSKSKYEYLYQSFMGENPLPSPGMAFKKSAIEKFLPLPCGLFQYSDWDLNNKFLLNSNIYVSDKCLVNYRISDGSVSSRSKIVIAREELEADILLDNFLKNCTLDNFRCIFENKFLEMDKIEEKLIPYFMARYALFSKLYSFRKWGYKKIINLISDCDYFNYLIKKYNLTFSKIISMCPLEVDKEDNNLNNKVKKYKNRVKFLIFLLIAVLFVLGVVICKIN